MSPQGLDHNNAPSVPAAVPAPVAANTPIRTMVEEISISGLGVIQEATVPLGPGLTVLTGETGAGKTMVVTSVGLLCGAKADSARVRAGSKQALVQGRVQIAAGSALHEQVIQAGVDVDEDTTTHAGLQVVLARSVAAAGRSRAWAGSRSVPASFLAQLAQNLIAVHGQSDQQRLLRPSQQRGAVDRCAGEQLDNVLQRYRQVYQQLAEDQQRLEQLTSQEGQRHRQAQLLRDGVERIEQVDPQPDEWESLNAQADRLAHAQDLHAAASQAYALLAGSEAENNPVAGAIDASTALAQAGKELAAVSVFDPELEALAQQIAQVTYQVVDVAAALASYVNQIEVDPARLDAIGARQEQLAGLTRRYAHTLPQVLQWAEDAAQRLAELDSDAEVIEALQRKVHQGGEQREQLAGTISKIRTAAATQLAREVSAELASLALPHAKIHVHVTQGDYGPWGRDEVALLLSANPGSPALPLQQAASGGELSRVMLALEVVLAGRDPVPVFVFDEVDAGVGGQAAVEVGRRLARLARHAQVLVVTHLPQVAAYADDHLVVVKSSDGSITTSGVLALDRQARQQEIARMLAGQHDSAVARTHAEELLTQAAAERERQSG